MTKDWKSNPIVLAVEPLRVDAMASAEQYARDRIEKVKAALAEHGNDINKAAPMPKSNIGHYEYILAEQQRDLFLQLTEPLNEHDPWLRSNQPRLVHVTERREAKFIADARNLAAAKYEAFVVKLVDKIGEVTSAKLTGNHVWAFSKLEVVKPDGERQVWQTKQIWNHSKLGLEFPQWPTRKLK